MKKQLFALCALSLCLFAACNKEKDEPTVQGSFTLDSPAEVTVPTEGDIVTVSFTSTVDWTAALNVSDDVATISKKSGTADDKSVKVTVMKFDTENETRTINLTFTPEGLNPVKVVLTQAGPSVPYFSVDTESFSVSADGGSVSFTISTNVEFETKTYEEFEAWAPFTLNGTTGTFNVAANNSYGSRQAYVKFTVPSIQVTDEESGEASDLVVRVYVSQEGIQYVNYSLSMKTVGVDMAAVSSGVLSEAVYGTYHLVCDGTNVYQINSTDGTYSSVKPTLGEGMQLTITNDDAGNVIAVTRTRYENDAYTCAFSVNVVTDPTTFTFKTVIAAEAWTLGGPAGSRVNVRGDITGNALVTVPVEGVAGSSMSNTIDYWVVSNGVAGEKQKINPAGIDATWGTAYWSTYPNNFPSVAALGTDPADGFILSGSYGGNTFYKVATDGTATAILLQDPAVGSDYAYQTVDVRTIGGKQYLVSVASSFFPYWSEAKAPRISIIAVDNIPATAGVIHEVADLDIYGTSNYNADTDSAIAPASDVKLYDNGGKIGVAYCDLNGLVIESFTFDPANF